VLYHQIPSGSGNYTSRIFLWIKYTVWGRDPVNMQMTMIGTIRFLKAVKKSEIYHMVMFSQQLYAM
jgi:hypothetical protein